MWLVGLGQLGGMTLGNFWHRDYFIVGPDYCSNAANHYLLIFRFRYQIQRMFVSAFAVSIFGYSAYAVSESYTTRVPSGEKGAPGGKGDSWVSWAAGRPRGKGC